MSLEDQAAEETSSDTLLDSATPELQEGEYFLSEGIKGAGDTPEWYNGSKYSSVAEQAKGYNELEKKFGGFTGAPKDGYAGPEGIEPDDALLAELTQFATETNMSQDAFSSAWELLSAQSGAVEEVTHEQEIAKLGDNAQQRIKTVEGFLKNNLDAEGYESVMNLVTTADSIKLVEMLVGATAPAKLPIEGGEHPTGLTWSDIETEMFKKNERGQMLRSVDPSHEAKIQKMMQEFGGDKPYQKMVG
ncbi:MAG: hypothetical protein P8P29_05105 [Flavobacteriaceae bacterium]|nr:hypothetical protein [Flavobacteriaceae bacterium]